jgi:hypothetical protein
VPGFFLPVLSVTYRVFGFGYRELMARQTGAEPDPDPPHRDQRTGNPLVNAIRL